MSKLIGTSIDFWVEMWYCKGAMNYTISEIASRRGLSQETLGKIASLVGLANKNWFGNTHDQTKNLTSEEEDRFINAVRNYQGRNRR